MSSSSTSPAPYVDHQLLNDYLNSQQHFLDKSTHSAPTLLMKTIAPDYAHPAIPLRQSTPTPTPTPTLQLQLPPIGFPHPPILSTLPTGRAIDAWHFAWNMPVQSLQTLAHADFKAHQRNSSSSSSFSSLGSSPSQYRLAGTSQNYPTFSNHLPTPTHTPTQESFVTGGLCTNFTPMSTTIDQNMPAHMSMKQALIEQSDDVPDFVHSARQSISSHGRNSPVTPHTTHDDLDGKLSTIDPRPVPKFERTYTDIAADTFYDPRAVAAATTPKPKPVQSSLLSPYRSNTTESVQRALKAAQYARSHSPTSPTSRSDSPFRRDSSYRLSNSSFNPRMISSTGAVQEHTCQADAAYAMLSQIQDNEHAQVKTISPKDALLDYRESDGDIKASLFPTHGANTYNSQHDGNDQFSSLTQSTYNTSPSSSSSPPPPLPPPPPPLPLQSCNRENWQSLQPPSNGPTSSVPSLQPPIDFDFLTPPSIPSNMPILSLPATSQYLPTPRTTVTPHRESSVMEPTPEFPAHLTSMESSASEAEPASGSQNSVLSDYYLSKPVLTGADSGTYSCTYHGCSQRFETPQKLQKHKREGHRSNAMTSVAILERNSQAGPHKCERTNPTTGKPCNTVFSRPYDLTRHEDTIHNGRKQKVRCALCTDEKSFSRSDALTRHMRVVHPEVEFPGKHKRRLGNHDGVRQEE